MNSAEHAQVLPDEFIERFAVIGPPARCTARLQELVDLGLDRLVITGPAFGSNRDHATTHGELLQNEVIPALR